MFGALTDKFQQLFSRLGGQKTLTEENLQDAVREVRMALLEADVQYSVASGFVKRVKEKALGEVVLKSVSPAQQFTKIVHDELVALMGLEVVPLDLNGKLNVILLCGLQGSGKTTTCAKLAALLKKEAHRKVMLVACDLQRPAAVEQLKRLGESVGVPVFTGAGDPVAVAREAFAEAKREGIDVLIVDTAGRLAIDAELMAELKAIRDLLTPREVLFVASAATGQDAVKTASEFERAVGITGSILTMLDGSARAGAALSIREATGKPLKFEGVGEKVADLQPFHPRSMADRILGMGDVINLVRKAKEHVDEQSQEELEKKLRKASFTFDDYLRQMRMVKKMGSLKSLLQMIPGMSGLGDLDISEDEFKRLEAMILSMTPEERLEKVDLIPSRRKRIARGSGIPLDRVNQMVKGFERMKQMMKNMPQLKSMAKKFGLGGMNLGT